MWDRIKNADRATLAVLGGVLAIVLFLCVNLITTLTLSGARADLTEDKIYTVSSSTREVLGAVTQPITLRLYMSSALVNEAPELRAYTDRVRQLLTSYQQLSAGKVRVEQIDPIPFSAAEDEAIGYNLQGFNLSRAGEQGYVGLVGTNSVDGIETIAALTPDRENYLEYDLTRMVSRLSRPTEPKIGVMDGLGLLGNAETGYQPAASISRLAEDFQLVQLGSGVNAIPDDINALVIIHPHDLTQSALYAIDQYVMRGGPVLLFIDVLAEHAAPDPNAPALPQFPDSNLDPLLAAWGVEMPPKLVVGDLSMALKVRAIAGSSVVVADYPPWLIVSQDNFNHNDVVTGQLSLMRLASAGSLHHLDSSKTTFTPLIQSTTNSMLFDQALVLRRGDPNELVNNFKASGVQQVLAARITGAVDTAFPNGPPPPTPPADNAPADPTPQPTLVAHAQKPIDVIVVADTDLLGNDMNVDNSGQPTTQNSDFIINALDSLSGGGQLIALRSQGVSFRPFTTVDAIEAAANEKYRATQEKLQADLKDTQDKLAALRGPSSSDVNAGAAQPEVSSAQQQQAIAQFNQKIVDVRQQLRDVSGELRAEIDALGDRLRLINILGIPVLIILAGIIAMIWRRLRLSNYLRRRQSAAS